VLSSGNWHFIKHEEGESPVEIALAPFITAGQSQKSSEHADRKKKKKKNKNKEFSKGRFEF